MALIRARQLLSTFDEELTDLQRQPLPAQNVQKVWLNGLCEGLRSISLILNDVILAFSGVDPDETPATDETPASGDSSPGAESGGGSGADALP